MAEKILWAEHVSQHFGGLVAVDNVSMSLNKGEIVGIIGPNGAGKTTFFNDITGMYDPTEGEVFYRNKNITGMKPYDVTRLGIARTFQNIRLFDRMTVIENVMVGVHSKTNANILDSMLRLKNHRSSELRAEEIALSVLDLVELSDYRYHYATSLPYGMQRKLEIARAIASDPEILLLDEPGAGMNESETNQLIEFIRQLRTMEYTILIIEHDMRVIMNICDRIYVLDHGKLIAHGKPAEIQTNQDVIEAYLGKEH